MKISELEELLKPDYSILESGIQTLESFKRSNPDYASHMKCEVCEEFFDYLYGAWCKQCRIEDSQFICMNCCHSRTAERVF